MMSAPISGFSPTRTTRGSFWRGERSRNATAPSTSRGSGTSGLYGRYSMRGVGAERSDAATSDMRITRWRGGSGGVLPGGAADEAHGALAASLHPAREGFAEMSGGRDVVEQLEELQAPSHAIVPEHIARQHRDHGFLNAQHVARVAEQPGNAGRVE